MGRDTATILLGAQDNAGTLKAAKLNVDELPELADRYDVQSTPTLAPFVQGQLVKRIVGYVAKAELQRQIESALRTLPTQGVASAGVES